jgi:membrane-anchored protein YejM (alkaline phosphatase superfamily)
LYYLDKLVQQVLTAAEKQSALNDTWVIITGDHAEEFNENGLGYWGHGSNFSRWQVQTPLLIKAPGQIAGAVENRMSLHQDIVPTLMQEALGCTGPLTDYSNGANLFHLPEKRGTVMASYMSSAYLVDGIIMDRTVNKKYDWLDMKQERSMADPGSVRELMQEERRFIKNGRTATTNH